MMKKKQQTRPFSGVVATPNADLKTLIHHNAQFFDKIIELIPANLYLPVEEDLKPWVQGLSKLKRASLKQQTRENVKQSRRDRLDPEKSQTTTLGLLKRNIGKAGECSKDEEVIEIKSSDGMPVTYEGLQQRLHQKLEMLRSDHGQGDKKRKREDRDSGSGKDKEKIETDFQFGKVILGDEDWSMKKKMKMGSKVKELEKAKKLKEACKENPVVATKHSWKAAIEKAMGVKVHNDPKLLKRSLQKEKKRREKSAGKWKDRVETRDKLWEEKQAKRRGNIEERANQKKARKIARREKKLMRPGFEARKEGYIGDKKD